MPLRLMLKPPNATCTEFQMRLILIELWTRTEFEDRKLTRPDYFPNTLFKRSVVCATGLVLIFCSSCPTMWKRPSKAFVVT